MKDLSLHILDIVRNSVVAGAPHIIIGVHIDSTLDCLTIQVQDNGSGMDAMTLEKVTDPFYTTRTTRKVGLGLSLLKANCIATGGDLTLQSEPGMGTSVEAFFSLSHIDRPPIGDLPGTLMTLLMSEESFDLEFHYTIDDQSFDFSTLEIAEMLEGDVDFRDYAIASWIEQYIEEHISQLK
jgi:anti-sigma regulatory factor (Ser/Thr protein kinase)